MRWALQEQVTISSSLVAEAGCSFGKRQNRNAHGASLPKDGRATSNNVISDSARPGLLAANRSVYLCLNGSKRDGETESLSIRSFCSVNKTCSLPKLIQLSVVSRYAWIEAQAGCMRGYCCVR